MAQRPFGFNVIGHVSGNFGLGVAARNTIRLLLELGYPVATVDVRGGGGEKGQDPTYADLEIGVRDQLPYSVSIYHMNPIEIRVLLQNKPRWFAGGETLNVCAPFWELPRIPAPWEPILSGMDAVFAPTRFIGDAVTAALPGLPVILLPQAVHVPTDIASDRARFGIPADALVSFVAFHTGSGLARKNPQAALAAYTTAFAGRDDAALVVKMTVAHPANPFAARAHDRQIAPIRALLDAAPNVIVIDRSLPYRDVLALYASCDILLSLHRSEGLGLHLMEAMALGRVVVATAWSGVMEFMTGDNSVEIGYDLAPVSSTPPVEAAYSAKFVGSDLEWAEPRIPEAVEALRRLAADPGLRARIGEQARSDMEARTRLAAMGTPFVALREMWDRGSVEPKFRERPAAGRLASHWRRSAKLMIKNAIKWAMGRV